MLSSSQIHPLPSLNVALEIDRSGRVAIRSPNNRVASPSIYNNRRRERAPLSCSTSGSPGPSSSATLCRFCGVRNRLVPRPGYWTLRTITCCCW